MCVYRYLCTYVCVVGHICKVTSLKRKVGQAKIFLKTCVRAVAS